MKKRIGILVVAYNAVNKLDWTLDRIPDEVWRDVEEVFLFDDCSTDNTYYAAVGYQQTKQRTKLTIRKNQENLGYGGNQKAGYRYAIDRGLDIVVLLHADGQYAPEVLPRLLEPLLTDKADMVFGSRFVDGGNPRSGGMPLYKYVGNRILTSAQNRIVGMNMSEFHSGYRAYSCAALKQVSFELNSSDWHFDTEILIQFHEAGLRIHEEPIPTYYGDEICHVNGIPYAINCVRTSMRYRLHKANAIHEPKYDVGARRYVNKTLDSYSSHSQILKSIEATRPARVLEIGTASGFLSEQMTNLGCRVTGIEQDVAAAAGAEAHCAEMIVGNVEHLNFDSLGRYDAVVLGDIVEHLRNPDAILSQIPAMLQPGGKCIISVPNVANLWVRLNLLFGRFNYARSGIMDATHLRFFTLKSVKELLAATQLRVVSLTGTPIPWPLVFGNGGVTVRLLNRMNWWLVKLRKTLFAYQFVIVCESSREQPVLAVELARGENITPPAERTVA